MTTKREPFDWAGWESRMLAYDDQHDMETELIGLVVGAIRERLAREDSEGRCDLMPHPLLAHHDVAERMAEAGVDQYLARLGLAVLLDELEPSKLPRRLREYYSMNRISALSARQVVQDDLRDPEPVPAARPRRRARSAQRRLL